MRWILLLLAACCFCLSSAHASDKAAENVCDVLQGGPNPAGKTIAIEQLPRGFVCRDGDGPRCPEVGNLAWVGRTDAGTRFWADTSDDSTGNRISVSLEQLREIESAFQSFLEPRAIDPSEVVIRVYDADGEQFEERKMRFGSLPRDFVLDMQRREEKAKTRAILDANPDPLAYTEAFPRLEAHPFLYAPIEMAPQLRVSNPCR